MNLFRGNAGFRSLRNLGCSLAVVALFSCSNKTEFSNPAKDSLLAKQRNAVGAGAAAAGDAAAVKKADDELQKQLDALKARVEANYAEFQNFKGTTDARFAEVNQRIKESFEYITKLLERVGSLETWKAATVTPQLEKLLQDTQANYKSIAKLDGDLGALGKGLREKDAQLQKRIVDLEDNAAKVNAKLDTVFGRLTELANADANLRKALNDSNAMLNGQIVNLQKADEAIKKWAGDNLTKLADSDADLRKKMAEADADLLKRLKENDDALRQKIAAAEADLLKKLNAGDEALLKKLKAGDEDLLKKLNTEQANLLKIIKDGDAALQLKIADLQKADQLMKDWMVGNINKLLDSDAKLKKTLEDNNALLNGKIASLINADKAITARIAELEKTDINQANQLKKLWDAQAAQAIRLDQQKMQADAIASELTKFKAQVARDYATREQLSMVQSQVTSVNKTMMSMYTELDKKHGAAIAALDNDLKSLKGQFNGFVAQYKKDVQAQKAELSAKFAQYEELMRRGDQQQANALKAGLDKLAQEFGGKLNGVSDALQKKLDEVSKTVGENHKEVAEATEKLAEAQAAHQKAISELGQQMKDALARIKEVERVASNALAMGNANKQAISLLSKDFETQKKEVAARFKLSDSKISALEADLKKFKEDTAKRFAEVRKETALMVGNLNQDLQTQFGKIGANIASMNAKLRAQDKSIAHLTAATNELEKDLASQGAKIQHMEKVSIYEKEFADQLDGNLLLLRDVLVASAQVENQFVQSMNLATGQNRGAFDAAFRQKLSVAGVCGVEPANADFARAGGIDYFAWFARIYARNLVMGLRTGNAEVDAIYFKTADFTPKGSLAELVMEDLLALEPKKQVPATCITEIANFTASALHGDQQASKDLRKLLNNADLSAAVKDLAVKLKAMGTGLVAFEAWNKEASKGLGADAVRNRAEVAQVIAEKSRLMLDLEDERADLEQIAKVSMELTANSIADDKYRAEMKKQLDEAKKSMEAQKVALQNQIKALEASDAAEDKKLRDQLQAQINTLGKQVANSNEQIKLLDRNMSTDAELAAAKKDMTKLMQDGLKLLDEKLMKMGAQEQAAIKESAQKINQAEVAMQGMFDVIATMASRSGDKDLLNAINKVAVNFNGKVPTIVDNYEPKITAVQHWFSGGFSRGSADVCLSLNPTTIKRSPFDWKCNVNFRSLSEPAEVGTASTGILRVHGQFGFVKVEAWRASVWSWDNLQDRLAAKTFDKTFCVQSAKGNGCETAPLRTVVRAGASAPSPYGDRGTFDLPNSDLLVSLVEGTRHQYNGVVYVTPGRLDGAVNSGGANQWKTGERYRYVVGLYSPVVLHFSKAPLRTLAPSEARVSFDIDANGVADRVGWIRGSSARTTGLLALPNAQGEVVDGSQLFGQAMNLGSSGKRAANGYEALAQFDTKGKGYVDASDPMFRKMVVWFDDNQDGVAQKAELVSLKDAGVSRIDHRFTEVAEAEQRQGTSLLDSNSVKFASKFYGPAACGSEGCASYDVFFGASEVAQAKK